ncbi:MAG TPA: cupin domain-containing protein [Thermoanaerobaculia bacterium]|nr:cupin domain-containing protein [Thermoanaerobaculia bacterium]
MPRSILVAIAIVVAIAQSAVSATAASTPTFTSDVAPIFFDRCGECHRDGGMAPMPLTSYDAARPWAKAIRREVASRRMPPFHAAPGDFRFSNDISLSDAEIATVLAWIDGGAPPGDAAVMPPLPDYAARAAAKPAADLVWEYPQSFTIAPGADLQRAFVVRNTTDHDLWIAGVDYMPEPSPSVHHMFAFTDPSGLGRKFEAEAKDGEPGFLGSVDGGAGTDTMMAIFQAGGGGLGGWALGAGVVHYPAGTGQLLPRGTDVVLQYHYWNGSEKAQVHQPKIGLYLAKGPVEKIVEFGGPAADDHLDIRAGDAESVHRADWTANEDVEVIGAMPHMHFLGKSMRLTLHYPDGVSKTLLDVPRFDFAWQTVYRLEQPLLLPKGTRVEMVAAHDNSAGHQGQRYTPPKNTRFGERSDDEMCDGILFLARRRGGSVADTPRILGGSRERDYRAGAAMEALIRYGPGGPPGVGLREQRPGRGHTYYQSAERPRVSSGVFQVDPMDVDMTLGFSEFIYLLEGELTLRDATGREETFRPGDAVVLPRGVPIHWRNGAPLREVFAVFDTDADDAIAAETFVRVATAANAPAASSDRGEGERVDFRAPDGSTVAVRELAAGGHAPDNPAEGLTQAELSIVLDGWAAVIDQDGRQGRIDMGDVVLLPPATPIAIRPGAALRRIVVTFDRLASDSAPAVSAAKLER